MALLSKAQLERAWYTAERALRGVGTTAHEWRNLGQSAIHLRRRLTEVEWGGRAWGMDVRGTADGLARLEPCRRWLPAGYTE